VATSTTQTWPLLALAPRLPIDLKTTPSFSNAAQKLFDEVDEGVTVAGGGGGETDVCDDPCADALNVKIENHKLPRNFARVMARLHGEPPHPRLC
jgi:hypothetical protein